MTLNHGFAVVENDGFGWQLVACANTFVVAEAYADDLQRCRPESVVHVLTWAEAEELLAEL